MRSHIRRICANGSVLAASRDFRARDNSNVGLMKPTRVQCEVAHTGSFLLCDRVLLSGHRRRN